MASLKELRDVRIKKLSKLRDLGIVGYPSTAEKQYPNRQIIDNFEKFEGKQVSLAGRLMSWREHGNIIFGHIQDESGKLQLLVQRSELADTSKENQTIGFKDLTLLDIGDFVQVSGEVTKTSRGEVSLKAKKIKLLAKALRPLPEKWEGLTDPEIIFRRRYLDLVMNPSRRELFRRKSAFWKANREFMQSQGFTEVETPVMEHVTGGADARPFVTHHHALDEDFYLRISTELFQKRLIGGGFEKIYTLGPNFRNEGIDDEHLQEYYQLEWYWAYANYRDNMKLVRDLFRFIAKEVYGKTKFSAKGMEFDLSDDWEEIDYEKAIKDQLGVDINKDSQSQMLNVLRDQGVVLEGGINKARIVDNLWKIVRKTVAGPAFLVNTPKFISPLAKSLPDDETRTERFQVILAGTEAGNGYSELNDPVDQYERFLEQQKARELGDEEAQMMDIDYVEMLEYGMPPTSGYGHSERVFWLLENTPAREATLFPQMKAKMDESSKELYPEFISLVNPKKKLAEISAEAAISEEVKAKFSGISYAYIVLKNVSIKKQDTELEKLKSAAFKSKKDVSIEAIKDIPTIAAYRKMFKETGVDPNSRHPSPEALLRRIAQGKGIYNINTAVDAYNIAVIESSVGLGGFDADKVKFPVTLRFATKGEKLHLLGDDKETLTKEGEIVYSDKQKLLTLDLNYRDIDESKIVESTKNIILFADGAPGIETQKIVDALNLGVKYIRKFCGGELGEIRLVK